MEQLQEIEKSQIIPRSSNLFKGKWNINDSRDKTEPGVTTVHVAAESAGPTKIEIAAVVPSFVGVKQH